MQCLIIDDLVLVDEQGLIHEGLLGFYESYRHLKVERGEVPVSPREWIPRARGAARRLLAKMLGANLRRISAGRSVPIFIDLPMVPRPATLTDARLAALTEYLTRAENAGKTWERLGRFDDAADAAVEILRNERRANLGHLNILKGNLAEVFSMPEQYRTLHRIKDTHPDAVLISGVRIRAGEGEASRLFSDNIIARWRNDGSLEVLLVFEVKSGYRGGAAGTEQVFEWIERRIEDGFQLVLPSRVRYHDIPRRGDASTVIERGAGDVDQLTDDAVGGVQTADEFAYTYDPDGLHSGPRVVALVAAERRVITARGMSQIGVDPSLGVPRSAPPVELGVTSEELDYLCAHLLLNR